MAMQLRGDIDAEITTACISIAICFEGCNHAKVVRHVSFPFSTIVKPEKKSSIIYFLPESYFNYNGGGGADIGVHT